MLRLFCPHNYTPFERFREEHRPRLIGSLTLYQFCPCLHVSFCLSCGKVKHFYSHEYGETFQKDFHLEGGEKDHHAVKRCLHCRSTVSA